MKWQSKVAEECGDIVTVLVQNKVDLLEEAEMTRYALVSAPPSLPLGVPVVVAVVWLVSDTRNGRKGGGKGLNRSQMRRVLSRRLDCERL